MYEDNNFNNTENNNGAGSGYNSYSENSSNQNYSSYNSGSSYNNGSNNYGNNSYNNNSYNNGNSGETKKKKSNWFLKGLAILLAAVVFGSVAGLSMLAVTRLTGVYDAYTGIIDEAVDTITGAGEEEKSETGSKILTNADTETTKTSTTILNDVSDIVEECMPCVVAINAKTEVTQYSWFGQAQTYEAPSSGSGIIIGENDTEYLIVTNNHVVENTTTLSVQFINEKSADVIVKGTDPDCDIAIVAAKKEDVDADTKAAIKIATLGDSDQLKVGQQVIAIGNALGYGQSVTVGYVSALNRTVQLDQNNANNLIQTDAAINPGNSGGAMINTSGEVVGINSAKYSSTQIEGMCFAIPISSVKHTIESLSERKTREVVNEAERGYLGIQGQSIDAQTAAMYDMPQGVYVYKVLVGGDESRSQLQEKDIITKLDAQRVDDMEDLKEALTHYKAGETVPVTIQRIENGAYVEKEFELTLVDQNALNSAN